MKRFVFPAVSAVLAGGLAAVIALFVREKHEATQGTYIPNYNK